MDESAQQRITYLLQEIDANICAAHRSATQICGTVRRHHQILRQIHEASRVWRPLFDAFTQQPAARRATRTPSRFSRPFTPGSTRAAASHYQRQQEQEREQQLAAEETGDDEDDASFVSREQTFKTTTLKKHQPPASDEDSLSLSINSDNLPRMSRTPYMPKSAAQSAGKTHGSTSTLDSNDPGRWSPRMTSPPRTGLISRVRPETGNAGPRQLSTPPSAISSVAYSSNSPGISRNLMKMGEFEFTPPRGKKSTSGGEAKDVDETDDSIATPYAPEFSTLKAMTPNTPLSNRLVGASLDVGSVSQEARLQDYDDSFNAGEPTPKFELSLLPAVFQRGVGAVQVSTLYSKFQGADDDKPAISVDQLAEMLPEYGKEKIEILLDTLVSRRLLRPFVVEGTMFWQIPV
ncbi:DASH complex subunit Ask1 [Phytophthora cinnamomi]|uniref:DASH complex subunit Ask1 n=1 Tax=Phytophthora cinnamomi TaxID=4785 RepID=UPI00355A3661|nr:DASH complex subunit Ask1 [Phytophthora cinnamomi]